MDRVLTGIMLASLAVSGPALADPMVSQVRLGTHPDRTRVVVELNESTTFDYATEAGGRRVIIELPETSWSDDMQDVAALGPVERVSRFRHASGKGLRLVLDMESATSVAGAYILQPDAGRPYRLVVDLAPATESAADPDVAMAESVTPEAGPFLTEDDPAPAGEDDGFFLAQEPGPAEDDPFLMSDEPGFEDSGFEDDAPMMMEGPDGSSGEAPPLLDAAPPPIAMDGTRQQWSGYVQGEVRLFPTDRADRKEVTASVAAEVTYEASWDNGMHAVTITPFGRLDLEDSARSHADIRELKWVGVFGDVEARVGVDRMFWGVTESYHLVDTINQIDAVEDVDEEDRLGQPMASLSVTQDWGTVTAFFLPYFRERTFPGADGRPGRWYVDDDNAIFASSDDDWRTDWAVRYATTVGPFDLGVAHFHGMERDPSFVPTVVDGNVVLLPRYDVVDRTSIDLQATFGAALWKFEGLTADAKTGPWDSRYYAFVGGLEYTLFNVFDGRADLGLLAEYLYDDRGTAATPFEDDVFLGMRWGGTDVNSTEFLVGAIVDTGGDGIAANVEASRRMWQHWRISVDARFFLDVAPSDQLYLYSQDDFIQLRLERFF